MSDIPPATTLVSGVPTLVWGAGLTSAPKTSPAAGIPDETSILNVELDRTAYTAGRISLSALISLDGGNTFSQLCRAVIDGGDTSGNGRGGTKSSFRNPLPPGTGRQLQLNIIPTGLLTLGVVMVTVS